MRVVVTGGLSFLGHAVTRRLGEAGNEVVALTSRPHAHSLVEGVDTVHVDICDRAGLVRELERVQPESICHLAAATPGRTSFLNPLAYYHVNVGGTVALLRAATTLMPLPLVFISTAAVYGISEGRVDESRPALPANPYGASKLASEELLRYQAETGALGVVTLRCFNIGGAVDTVGDSDISRIIPKTLEVAAGRAGHVTINGDGTAIREFVHVADVADAVMAALSTAVPGQAHTYNVGGDCEGSVLDVVRAAERITGRRVPTEHKEAKPEPAVIVADTTRIRDELGWRPRHSTLDEIVRDAWQSVSHSTTMRAD